MSDNIDLNKLSQALFRSSDTAAKAKRCNNRVFTEEEIKQLKLDQDEIRKGYITILDEQQTKHANDRTWWRTQWRAIGEGFSRSFDDDVQPLLDKELDVYVQGSHTIGFLFRDYTAITIGRLPGCHVSLSKYEDQTCSRVHAIILLLPQRNEIHIMDVGSVSGIDVIKREHTEEGRVYHTLKNHRAPIILPWGENVWLQMGSKQVNLFGRKCVICLENNRSCMLRPCNHYVCCKDCVDKVVVCPICRQSIQKVDHNVIACQSNAIEQ
jgi:hypothetical protein